MPMRHRYSYGPTAHLQVSKVNDLQSDLTTNIGALVLNPANMPVNAAFSLTIKLPRFELAHVKPKFADNTSSMLLGLFVFDTDLGTKPVHDTKMMIGKPQAGQHPVRKRRGKRSESSLLFDFTSLQAAGFTFAQGGKVLVLAHSLHKFFDTDGAGVANPTTFILAKREFTPV